MFKTKVFVLANRKTYFENMKNIQKRWFKESKLTQTIGIIIQKVMQAENKLTFLEGMGVLHYMGCMTVCPVWMFSMCFVFLDTWHVIRQCAVFLAKPTHVL